MRYCIKCGQKLPDNAMFCAGCGVATTLETMDALKTKTVFSGQLYKCPNCGELLDAFVTVCPVCDYELRGTNITSYVHEFSLKLEKAVDNKQRIELIKSFYIPNTKEDIYEFFILAISNITVGGYDEEAWLTKLEQTYLKAKLTFGHSEEYTQIKELYDKIKKRANRKRFFGSKIFKATLVFSIGLLLILFGFVLPLVLDISDYDSAPFYVMALFGFLPFIIGLVMYLIPDKKNRHRRKNKSNT